MTALLGGGCSETETEKLLTDSRRVFVGEYCYKAISGRGHETARRPVSAALTEWINISRLTKNTRINTCSKSGRRLEMSCAKSQKRLKNGTGDKALRKM